ncbi:MAG: aspartate-semialdehyde dehydrogenase [Deltaproteobacteria bacterium]|jgi:aspartate-semialdehyde dehydrogenase|nr:MAG: aspartate-semialdehyde dehydrogenase [Deltaproteobacteria bacterium]
MKRESYNIAIVGATGAVGQEMIKILEERNFPVGELKLLASERSKGREVEFKGEKLIVEQLEENSFKNIHIALFSAGASRSREYAPKAVQSGAVVIDNSSAFRMEPDVPLVIPEINPHRVADYRKKGIIANPNCTTAITLMALKPLHDIARIRRVIASSYQAVSGAGAQAIEELRLQIRAWLEGKPLETKVFPYQIAFNLIPHIDSFLENGYTKEEMKLHNETRKILEDESIQVAATTVRVPVFRAHSVALNIETERKITVEQARKAIEDFPGIKLVDDPYSAKYPMPIEAAGKDECFVGRIREDYTIPSGLNLWVVGDQLRKGAALNAVQIAEILIRDYV